MISLIFFLCFIILKSFSFFQSTCTASMQAKSSYHKTQKVVIDPIEAGDTIKNRQEPLFRQTLPQYLWTTQRAWADLKMWEGVGAHGHMT